MSEFQPKPGPEAPARSSRRPDAPGAAGAELSGSLLDDRDVSDAFALLADLSEGLTHSLDLDTALRSALARIVDHLSAEAGSLWLVEDDEWIVCRAAVSQQQIEGVRLSLSEGIVGACARENVCELVEDASIHPEFASRVDESSDFRTRSLVCAPLSFSDRALGAIEMVNKRTGSGLFTERDSQLLRVLAASAALAIRNARMTAQAALDQAVKREVELAAEIQRSLLPAERDPDFPVVGTNLPARSVSGDFFDFLETGDDHVAFCLGDVSGKGVNAALLAARTASLYRHMARAGHEPGLLLRALNDELVQTATRGMFVTMTAGVLDRKRQVIRLASAGHEPALLHHESGAFSSFPAEAPPLGILEDQAFPESEVGVGAGTLYVYSDGVTEALGEAGEQLGVGGVKRLIERFAGQPLSERVRCLVRELQCLAVRDDLTLLAVTGSPKP